MRPGKVIEILENGNIKVEAPGLFSREDVENLPVVMPWFTGGTNSYNTVELYDWVWILNVSDNPLQLFWFRKDDHKKENAELESLPNIEVLCNKSIGKGRAQLYYSDSTGWVMKAGDANVTITGRGDVSIGSESGGKISVSGTKTVLGEGSEPAVLGNKLSEILQQIAQALLAIQQAANGNYMTAPIGAALATLPTQIGENVPGVLSSDVTVS